MTAVVQTSFAGEVTTHAQKMAIMDAVPVHSEDSDTECAMKNDDDFWSKINLDSLQMSPNGSKLTCSQPIADKRARHKLVERRRRDRTRAFVEQLQAVLPNIEQRRQNPNVNVILEKTLDYLHSIKIDRHDSSEQGDCGVCDDKHSKLDVVQIFLSKVANSMPIDDITTRKYVFSFESAPFGIVISQIDGVFLKANEFFRTLFNFPQGAPLLLTMFSLTASQDLATTMKVHPPSVRACHASLAPFLSLPINASLVPDCDLRAPSSPRRRNGRRRRPSSTALLRGSPSPRSASAPTAAAPARCSWT
jgi:hypothetical protein